MTEAEYMAYFSRLLHNFNGSIDNPSGWGGGGNVLYFSCTTPPIDIPLPHTLTEEQRTVIVAKAKKRYGFE
ncbi:MAG: hypothetical protein KIT48_07585 [Pseudolabrys sp.]|nr:hypothetical protein [Pseudolabrys sp.]